MLRSLLGRTYFENRLLDYAIAVGIILALSAALRMFKWLLLPRHKHWAAVTKTSLDDFLIETFEKTLSPLLYFGALYFGLRSLILSLTFQKGIEDIGIFLFTFYGIRFILQIFDFVLMGLWVKKQPEPQKTERHMKSLRPILSVIVWGLGFVFLLDNLGFRVSTIVAGLGIGGVAVALAAQAVLADMFSYVAILFDRPFELDDFIILGDFMGTVDHIGIKTTRIRSLGGEQLVFSNKDLTDSRLRNYKRMRLRRVVFKLGLTYDTTPEKLKLAVALVKKIIMNMRDTRFDRAHFFSYGDFNLEIEVAYYVLSTDYNKYMDTQQDINLRIKEAFETEGIDFAFPTQTIHMANR